MKNSSSSGSNAAVARDAEDKAFMRAQQARIPSSPSTTVDATRSADRQGAKPGAPLLAPP